jgi:hypothetical protein
VRMRPRTTKKRQIKLGIRTITLIDSDSSDS